MLLGVVSDPVPAVVGGGNLRGVRRYDQLAEIVGEPAARRIVAHWHGQQPTNRIIGQLSQQSVKVRTRQIRPRRIVHQHPIELSGTEFGQA